VLVAVVGLILAFMALESLPLLARLNLFRYLTGDRWLPVSDPPVFEILPFIVSSAFVTIGAMLLATPFGLAAAVYMAEMSPQGWRLRMKPVFELLAGIPSVIYGLLGLMVVAPVVQRVFDLDSGLSGFTAALLLAVMVLPTIISLSDDAIRAVPRDYRDASLALGASQWKTLVNVTLPAASSGVKAAMLLASGRALGETMLVLMVAGGRISVPTGLFQPMRTMTATLAAEVNYTAFGSDHYRALFGIGFVLLLTTLLLSSTAERYSRNPARGKTSAPAAVRGVKERV
jgi:phosphate transport system permease protein